jgi:hypothetical protein
VKPISFGHSIGDAGTMNQERHAMSQSVFTIGDSTHPLGPFLALLAQHQIGELVDVRRTISRGNHP